MTLALFEQQFHDVALQLCGPRQPDPIGRRRAGRRLPDSQCHSVMHRDDLRDRRLAIEHRDGLATTDSAEVFTQSRLELRDTDLLHDPL